MTDKKTKRESKTNSVQISRNRAGGKKKPDLFARLRDEHPLDDMFEQERMMPASASDANLLADISKPASLLAGNSLKPASLLAGSTMKTDQPASKLADDFKPASRSASEALADLRKTVSGGKRQQIAIRIRPEVKQKIDVFLAQTGITQQDFFEKAASRFIEDFEELLAGLEKIPASMLAHDDRRLMMWKTRSEIINLHLRCNSHLTRWKPADDEVGQEFNNSDLRVIEIAILTTQFNAGFKKINSFKYYREQIEQTLADFEAGNMREIDSYLAYTRQTWERLKPQQ